MSKHKTQDILYSQPLEAITDFVFDESVVHVFRDMIGRSVPGYSTLLSMIPVLARHYVKNNSRCYDLGCSLGASTLAMRHGIDAQDTEIISVDNSPAMIEQCQRYIANDKAVVPVKLVCADIRDISVICASMVVMNFTLQFIERNDRSKLLDSIYQGLNTDGVLLLSEKIHFSDEVEQEWMTDLHHEFKKANGYSELEISQKRSALENVLVPETIEKHKQRLTKAGFRKVIVWFQCFNFVSLLAIK
ncbi:MAG: carboxy-S-adenosyl-L-methionine synthase CmoA [Gammaproteobacteria bacterium]|nr:carboxy-S-adenosyl-L-methionine synthase CmoA [Gammaproteobacteria bacterium]